MKRISLFFCFLIFSSGLLLAQSSDVLFSLDDAKVSKEEFQRIYTKNKVNISNGDVVSVNDYLELYINFKLKVLEAKKLGFDTTKSFLNEFNGYKKQLATPYLIDIETNEKLIEEAYERMKYEIRASHILIKLSPDASPVETNDAYEKAIKIRRRIAKGEEPFEMVAKGSSDDPSVKNNGGDLGYFTVFQMIYPFENAVYNSEIGSLTYPVRTKFGYHIIKLTDKRKARGTVKVAHIMLTVPRGTAPEIEKQKKELINELYHKIKQGEDFYELAKEYSDDKGSARNGGELPWFGTGRMVEEFEKTSFTLTKNGEVSQPIKTSFGWHIIKRIDRKEIPSFKEARAEIKNKVAKGRAEIAKEVLINRLKKEYNFKEKEANIPVLFDSLENVYTVKQEYIDGKSKLNGILFSLSDKVYFQKDFAEHVRSKRMGDGITPYQYKILYDNFIQDKIMELEEASLEEKYPDYKFLLKEYHDGMLLFEVTDEKIWTKAVNDSVGLENYYRQNKKKYMWKERWEGALYICANQQVFDNLSKIVNKRNFGKTATNKDVLEQFNANGELVKIKTGIFSQEEDAMIDYLIWDKKNNEIIVEFVLHKGKIRSPEIKTFNEAKGFVISDYQDYLDKEWIKSLRAKYTIQVNQSVLSSIK